MAPRQIRSKSPFGRRNSCASSPWLPPVRCLYPSVWTLLSTGATQSVSLDVARGVFRRQTAIVTRSVREGRARSRPVPSLTLRVTILQPVMNCGNLYDGPPRPSLCDGGARRPRRAVVQNLRMWPREVYARLPAKNATSELALRVCLGHVKLDRERYGRKSFPSIVLAGPKKRPEHHREDDAPAFQNSMHLVWKNETTRGRFSVGHGSPTKLCGS